MESVVKGLAAIRAKQESDAARRAEMDRPKGEWFKIGPGESVKVRFLQELDEEAVNYKPERGVGFVAVEHNAPGKDGWQRRALCTLDSEGRCYACEQHNLDPKAGWRQKSNFYINVLLDDGSVKILSRNSNSSFFLSLVDEANGEDEDGQGSITDNNFKITRQGEGTQTTWIPRRLTKDTPFDDSKVELFDLETVAIRKIEYDKQPGYYGAAAGDGDSSTTPPKVTVDEEW